MNLSAALNYQFNLNCGFHIEEDVYRKHYIPMYPPMRYDSRELEYCGIIYYPIIKINQPKEGKNESL